MSHYESPNRLISMFLQGKYTLKNKINIVEEPMEKQEMWTFTDTECWVDKNVAFKCSTPFQVFYTKKFQVFLQYYSSTELSKSIYKNIAKSGLF